MYSSLRLDLTNDASSKDRGNLDKCKGSGHNGFVRIERFARAMYLNRGSLLIRTKVTLTISTRVVSELAQSGAIRNKSEYAQSVPNTASLMLRIYHFASCVHNF